MATAIAVGPEQLQGAIQGFLVRFSGTEERVRAVEAMLNSPAGRLWRRELGKWTTMVIPVSEVVPDAHREWRPVVRDAMRFVVQRLSAARLAPKIVEQMEASPEIPADVRLLKLITKVPGLQKVGQTVARNRHVEPKFRAALSQLENSISDVTPAEAKKLIRNELGERLAYYRVTLAAKILSEASVSAVVAFTWLNPETRRRERGVFKVLKPHVPAYYAEDMDILQRLAVHLGKKHRSHQSHFAGVAETLGDVMHLLEREVDFRREQLTLRDALGEYRSIEGARVPHVIEALCTDAVTAMSLEEGFKITEVAERAKRKRSEVAERLVEALVGVPTSSARQNAVFHADPHAGNLLYDKKRDDIVILDWALAERLNREQRRQVILLTIMTALRDPDGMAKAIENLRLHGGQNDAIRAEHTRERVRAFVDELPLTRIPGPMDALQLLDVLAREGTRFPAPLAMFRKAAFTLDGVVEDIAGTTVPVDAVIRRYALTHWGRTAGVALSVLTPLDWASIQWSALTFFSRIWFQALRPSPVPARIG